jgi:hypothetical protein
MDQFIMDQVIAIGNPTKELQLATRLIDLNIEQLQLVCKSISMSEEGSVANLRYKIFRSFEAEKHNRLEGLERLEKRKTEDEMKEKVKKQKKEETETDSDNSDNDNDPSYDFDELKEKDQIEKLVSGKCLPCGEWNNDGIYEAGTSCDCNICSGYAEIHKLSTIHIKAAYIIRMLNDDQRLIALVRQYVRSK